MDVFRQGTGLYERCPEGMRSPNCSGALTVWGLVSGPWPRLAAAGLVALVLVADNVTGRRRCRRRAPRPLMARCRVRSPRLATRGPSAPAVCVYATGQRRPRRVRRHDGGQRQLRVHRHAPPGSTSVLFDPTCKGTQTSTYATQYYNDVPDIAAVTWVTVPAGGSVGGIDADLQLAGTISGARQRPERRRSRVCA